MLQVLRQLYDEMGAHALQDDPNECCGILAGKDGKATRLYRVANIYHSPYRYAFDPKEQLKVMRELESNNMEEVAFYHSHTHTPAYPSATDVRLATYPDVYYIVISLADEASPHMRAFRIVDGKVTEHELKVLD